jgi:excinuclease ABC subunit B
VDNRPLKFEEWDAMRPQTVHVSATPGKWEMQQTQGIFTEQVIRPTGLIDPPVEIRPVSTNGASQVDDVIHEVKEVAGRGFRSLITTLTKKMAEDLTDYMHDQSIRVRYMHSDIDTLERIEIIRDLRLGKFDVLVGINLLREGLDIPECAFVGILDADKEGFLRSETSLVQTIGRAARNSEARVVLYGDRVTGSMQRAIDETDRRRARQVKHNELNNITPKTVLRGVADTVGDSQDAQRIKDEANRFTPTGQIKKKFIENSSDFKGGDNIITVMADIEKQMFKAAENLEFEKAAELRDELERLKSNS